MSAPSTPDWSCPICGAEGAQLRFRLTEFSILECRACRQVYLRPLPSLLRRTRATQKARVSSNVFPPISAAT